MEDIQIFKNLRKGLSSWIANISIGGGKYKFASHACDPYSLDATSLAVDLKNMLKMSTLKDGDEIKKYINGYQSGKDGFYHEVFEEKYLFGKNNTKTIEMSATYLSFQICGLLRLLNMLPKYEFKYYRGLLKEAAMKKYLRNNLPWEKSPWGAGGMIDSMSTMISTNIKSGYEEYAEAHESILKWLEENQDPGTGLWGNISVQGYEGVVNGGYHALRGTYIWHNRRFNKARKIIDTLIKYISTSINFKALSGNGCCDLDAFFLLSECVKLEPDYRYEQICEIVYTRLVQLDVFKKKDGGFSFFPNSAEDEHNYYKVTKGFNESDVQGGVFYLQTLLSMYQILHPGKGLDFNNSFTHGGGKQSYDKEK
jgi:hypothetical protein